MKGSIMLICVTAFLMFALSACNSRSTAQTQSERDQETREKIANATEKAKEESKVAAHQLDLAARKAGHEADVAAQGVKEGWDQNRSYKVNLNSATLPELRSLGLNEAQAQRIINGRPYRDKNDLVKRGILSQSSYDNVQDRVTVPSGTGRQ